MCVKFLTDNFACQHGDMEWQSTAAFLDDMFTKTQGEKTISHLMHMGRVYLELFSYFLPYTGYTIRKLIWKLIVTTKMMFC